jgi:hypothetical protein
VIITGRSRNDAGQLAAYLTAIGENERVWIPQGFMAGNEQELKDLLHDMEAFALHPRSRCEQPLYHATINPEPGEIMDEARFQRAVEMLAEGLGMKDRLCGVVMHEKDGRPHAHVVFNRVDPETGKAWHDGHNFARHEEIAERIAAAFGHASTPRAHYGREWDDPRPPFRPSDAEHQRAKRKGVKLADVRAQAQEAHRGSDNGAAFIAALEDRDLIFARGNRRDFVIVDREGLPHNAAKLCGVRVAEMRAFMQDVEPSTIMSFEDAKAVQALMRQAEQGRGALGQAGERQPPSEAQPEPQPAPYYRDDAETAQQLQHHDAAFSAARDRVEREADANPASQRPQAKPQDTPMRAERAQDDAQQRIGRQGARQARRKLSITDQARRAAAKATVPIKTRGLSTNEQEIKAAYRAVRNGIDFKDALFGRGFTLARVTTEDLRSRAQGKLEGMLHSPDAWMLEGGGVAALDAAQLESAQGSYQRWLNAGDKNNPRSWNFGEYVDYVHYKWSEEIETAGGITVMRAAAEAKRAELLAARSPAMRPLVPLGAKRGDLVAVNERGQAYLVGLRTTGQNPDVMGERLTGLDTSQLGGVVATQAAIETGHAARTTAVANLLEHGNAQTVFSALDAQRVTFVQEGGRACVVTSRHVHDLTTKQEAALASMLPLADARHLNSEDRWSQLPDIENGQRFVRGLERDDRRGSTIVMGLTRSLTARDGGPAFAAHMAASGYDVLRDQGNRLHVERHGFPARVADVISRGAEEQHLSGLLSGPNAVRQFDSRSDEAELRNAEMRRQMAERAAREGMQGLRGAVRAVRKPVNQVMGSAETATKATAKVTQAAATVLGRGLGAVSSLFEDFGKFDEREADAKDGLPSRAEVAGTPNQPPDKRPDLAAPIMQQDVERARHSPPQSADLAEIYRRHLDEVRRRIAERDQDRERDQGERERRR